MADQDEFGAFLIGFIIGGLTGAAISLLMAPQTGEETRVYLKERAIELRDKAQETASTAADQVSSTATDLRGRAGDLANKAKTTTSDLRQRAQGTIEEQVNRLSSMRKGGDQSDMGEEPTV